LRKHREFLGGGILTRTAFSLLANAQRLPEIFACLRETGQWLPITLAYLGLRQMRYPYELRLRTGQVATLREQTDLIIFWMVFARRHYPVRSSDRVIIDVGANIGLFTLYAARQAPQAGIIAIEPFPDTCRALLDLVDRNCLRDRVTVLDCAVAGASGTGMMDSAAGIPSQYRRIYSATTSTLNVRHRGPAGLLETADGVPVRAKTLSEVMDSANISSADLVKMNIHGSEYEVLMSMAPNSMRRCKQIAVQYHELPAEMKIGKEELFEHLRKAGFRLVSDHDTLRGSGLAVLTLDQDHTPLADAA
jgi:FkbM family methyltransferase